MINYVNDNVTATNLTATTKVIVAGLYVGKPPTTNVLGINLGASNASNNINTCRIYYSQITMNPIKALSYVESNRNKKLYIEILSLINITTLGLEIHSIN